MAENRLALIWGVVFVWLTQIVTPLRAGTGSFMCFLKCLAHAPSLMISYYLILIGAALLAPQAGGAAR